MTAAILERRPRSFANTVAGIGGAALCWSLGDQMRGITLAAALAQEPPGDLRDCAARRVTG